MKFIKITSIVFSLHTCLAVILVFQSGCQTMEREQLDNSPYIADERYGIKADDYEEYEEQEIVAQDNSVGVTCTKSFKSDDFSGTNCTNRLKSQPDDNFVEPTCTRSLRNQSMDNLKSQSIENVRSQSTDNRRFKPTRPCGDFSCKEGLLTSLNDIKPQNLSVSSKENSFASQEKSYVVKSGDSLWKVAQQHKISVAELASANSINRDTILKVGQKLIVPVKKNIVEPTAGSVVEGGTYTIRKGDTLSEIAIRFKVSVDAIKKANNIQNNVIIAGKKINIPGVSSQTIAVAAPVAQSKPAMGSFSKEGTYQVQNGDSLSVIANRFGVTVADLMIWNKMADARKLRAGQALIVANQNKDAVPMVQASLNANAPSSIAGFAASSSASAYSSPEEEMAPFDFFEDDDLFDTSDEIPIVAVTEV